MQVSHLELHQPTQQCCRVTIPILILLREQKGFSPVTQQVVTGLSPHLGLWTPRSTLTQWCLNKCLLLPVFSCKSLPNPLKWRIAWWTEKPAFLHPGSRDCSPIRFGHVRPEAEQPECLRVRPVLPECWLPHGEGLGLTSLVSSHPCVHPCGENAVGREAKVTFEWMIDIINATDNEKLSCWETNESEVSLKLHAVVLLTYLLTLEKEN